MAIEKDSVYRQQEKIAETSAENMGLVDIDVADNILSDVTMLEDGSAVIGEQDFQEEISFDSYSPRNLLDYVDGVENDEKYTIYAINAKYSYDDDLINCFANQKNLQKNTPLLTLMLKKENIMQNFHLIHLEKA